MLRTRFAFSWAESLEGLAAGESAWALLARCWTRLLATWIDPQEKTKEMRIRLRLWEQGRTDELLERLERARGNANTNRQQANDRRSPTPPGPKSAKMHNEKMLQEGDDVVLR